MIELVLEANHLILELDDFSFAVDKLRFFVFQIEGLCVDELVEVIDSSKLLGNIILECSCLSSEIGTLFALELVLIVEFIDFLSVLSVSISKVVEFLLEVLLLRE